MKEALISQSCLVTDDINYCLQLLYLKIIESQNGVLSVPGLLGKQVG